MEMILQTLQFGTITTLIEQTDGLRHHEIVIWSFVLHYHLILLALLVELELLFWVEIGISEHEVLILESLVDRQLCVKVDRCLLYAIANSTFFLLLDQIVVSSEPIVLSKLSWPLIKSIHIVLTIVIVKVMLMLMGTPRHTSNNWQLDTIDLPWRWHH